MTRCWGFLKREGRLPSNSEIENAKALVGSDKLVLDAALTTVQFKQPGVEINLGSIGKGYALDVVSEHFRKAERAGAVKCRGQQFSGDGFGAGLARWRSSSALETETIGECSTARVCDVDEW